MFKEKGKQKVSKEKALQMCSREVGLVGARWDLLEQGGFMAEVTTHKETVNLKDVFENKVIPVWLGAQRVRGGQFRWEGRVV